MKIKIRKIIFAPIIYLGVVIVFLGMIGAYGLKIAVKYWGQGTK
jgi:hypothetical protein